MHIIQATVTSEHVHTNVYNSPVLLHVHIYLCLLRMYVRMCVCCSFPVAPCVCTQLFDGILSTLPRQTSGGGKSAQEVIDELAADILSKLPLNFDIEKVMKLYPVLYEESMNTVLRQELI